MAIRIGIRTAQGMIQMIKIQGKFLNNISKNQFGITTILSIF